MRFEKTPIQVCVVVRGPGDRVIHGLRRQNFRLFDDGRVQRVADFAENLVLPSPAAGATLTTPRYIALYFDDIHLDSTGVIRATDGADGYFSKHLGQWDRVGVFTASGQNTLDFTHDVAKLHQALLAIRPHPPAAGSEDECPRLTDYEAYLILYVHDSTAREVAIEEAQSCGWKNGDPVGGGASLAALRHAQSLADTQAQRVLAVEELRSSEVIEGLDRLIARVATLPDPRSITFISPGFLTAKFGHRLDQISERALRLNIIINTLDLSSEISEPAFDTGHLSTNARHRVALAQAQYGMLVDRASMAADVLTDLAGATGGTFVPNTYAPEFAFPMAAPLPQSYYVLTFYPNRLRADGRFHRLRVGLVKRSALYIQARDGYYAPGTPAARRPSTHRVRRARRHGAVPLAGSTARATPREPR